MIAHKLRAGMKAFDCNGSEKFFHRDSARPLPFYPSHAESFTLLVDVALDAHEASSGPHNDRMVFAVLYGYRHALELNLKDLVRLGVYCNELRLEDVEKALGGHYLLPLWERVRPFLAKCYPSDGEQLLVLDGIVKDFHSIDPDGQSIRYDRQKDSTRRKFDNLPSHVGVTTLRTVMDAAFHYLEFAYGGIYDYEDECRNAM
jgi:hypothetical protein